MITGSVAQFASRKKLQEFIEIRGGKMAGSVTPKTNYHIDNDITSASSKNKKTKELGVQIISEQDILKIIGD